VKWVYRAGVRSVDINTRKWKDLLREQRTGVFPLSLLNAFGQALCIDGCSPVSYRSSILCKAGRRMLPFVIPPTMPGVLGPARQTNSVFRWLKALLAPPIPLPENSRS